MGEEIRNLYLPRIVANLVKLKRIKITGQEALSEKRIQFPSKSYGDGTI
jgi:hypothetical protein